MARKTDPVVIGRILEQAEQLYGQHGFGAVSLTTIRKAAGSGNKNAITYHYGGEDGLIRAILTRRVPQMESMRAAQLARVASDGGMADIRLLTAILYEPLLQQMNDRGERSLARFVLALLTSPQGRKWSAEYGLLQPSAMVVMDRMAELTGISLALLYERQRLVAIMVLMSVFNRQEPFDRPDMDQALIDHVLDIAAAAIQVPVSKACRSLATTYDADNAIRCAKAGEHAAPQQTQG